MHLPIIIVMLAAILAAEFTPAVPLQDPDWRTLIVMVIAFCVTCLAMLQSEQLALLRQAGVDRTVISRSHARRETFFSSVWFGSSAAILFILRWPQVVRYNLELADWILLDELLILLPLFGPLVIAWYIFAGFDTDHSATAATSNRFHQAAKRQQFAVFFARIRFQLLLVMLPSLLFFVMRDLSQLLESNSPSSSIRALVTFLIPGCILAAMPMFFKAVLQSSSVRETEFGLRQVATCRSMGVKVRDIRVWWTKNRIINALVVGGVPGLRRIYFSDALLQHFDDDQVDAIARHEAAHIKRHHVLGRILALFLPVTLVFSWQIYSSPSGTTPLANMLSAAPTMMEILLLPAFAIYGIVVLGLLSRLYEHESDLVACCRFDSASKKFTFDQERTQDYLAMLNTMQTLTQHKFAWLHPKTASRIGLLQRIKETPPLGKRILRYGTILSFALVLTSIASPVIALCARRIMDS